MCFKLMNPRPPCLCLYLSLFPSATFQNVQLCAVFYFNFLSFWSPSGIMVRSSAWLGWSDIIQHISVANNTDVWPEVFCVSSAVRITSSNRSAQPLSEHNIVLFECDFMHDTVKEKVGQWKQTSSHHCTACVTLENPDSMDEFGHLLSLCSSRV